MRPSTPVTTNEVRQPKAAITAVTMGSDRAVPTRAPESKMLVAKARSCLGNHSETTLALDGYAPASPTPSRSRKANSEVNPRARAVAAVKTDHQITATEYISRAPSLS